MTQPVHLCHSYHLYKTYKLTYGRPVAIKEYKISEAREKLASLYDESRQDGVAVITRGSERAVAMLPADRLVEALAALAPFAVEVSLADEGVSAWLTNAPVHSSGADLDEAAANLLVALRDYADLWDSELKSAPNHRDRWSLVHRVKLLDDAALHKALFDDDSD